MTFEKYWQDNYASKGYQYGEESLALVKMGWSMHANLVKSCLSLTSKETALLGQFITSDDESPEITLEVWYIVNEDDTVDFGLIGYYTEYPEEGALLIKEVD